MSAVSLLLLCCINEPQSLRSYGSVVPSLPYINFRNVLQHSHAAVSRTGSRWQEAQIHNYEHVTGPLTVIMWQGMKILRCYAVTPFDLSMESSVNEGDQVHNI